MQTRDFCFWLQGFFEIHDAGIAERGAEKLIGTPLDPKQVQVIRQHLALVFKHESSKPASEPAQPPLPGMLEFLKKFEQSNDLTIYC